MLAEVLDDVHVAAVRPVYPYRLAYVERTEPLVANSSVAKNQAHPAIRLALGLDVPVVFEYQPFGGERALEPVKLVDDRVLDAYRLLQEVAG